MKFQSSCNNMVTLGYKGLRKYQNKMTQYNTLNINSSHQQLNKSKSGKKWY